MKKEYLRPEAELMKFVETEEIMGNAFGINESISEGPLAKDWGLDI